MELFAKNWVSGKKSIPFLGQLAPLGMDWRASIMAGILLPSNMVNYNNVSLQSSDIES